MNLHDYFCAPGSLTPVALAKAIGVSDAAQVRAWRHGYGNRKPEPASCVAIEAATHCKVMRWDLRPDDWHRIWPELVRVKGAPDVPTAVEAA